MIFEVSHKTVYHYTAPVAQAHHLVHLAPRPHERQRIISHMLLVDPAPAARNDFVDYFGNPASTVTIESIHSELLIHSRSLIEVTAAPPVNLTQSEPWDKVAAQLAPAKKPYDIQVIQYLMPSQHTGAPDALVDFARSSFPPGRPILECARDLTHRIFCEFTYDDGATDVATTIDELLKIRRGVCQDFAHVFIAAARALGAPARYVSGYYLRSDRADQDAGHAWAEAHVTGFGWVAFDAAHGVCTTDRHVRVAVGPDYLEAAPIRGARSGGAEEELTVAVRVQQGRSIAQS